MIPREYPNLYIGGEWRKPESSNVFDVISPRSGEKIGFVPRASKADIDAAVEAARKAFYESDWPRRPVRERADLCRALGAAINKRQKEFTDLIVEEMGCNWFLADLYQATAPTLHWNYYAHVGEHYRYSELRVADLSPFAGGSEGGAIMPYTTKSLVVKEPVGVVAVLCAYNFALPCVGQKAGPAVVAGCTVVIKVPEPDPLAIFAMGDLISEVGFPPGVINIVAAGPEESEHLISHPDIDMVSFTGSTKVGSRIGEVCGSLVRPCVLELGGKSAGIVLRDADLDTAIPTLVGISVGTNAGQSCVCISRFIVPRELHDEIANRLVEAFRSLKVGDPTEHDTVVPPLISEAHRERVLGMVRDAVDEGATLATGGKAPEDKPRGWYVEPTLLTNVSNDMTVAQQEVFGPVVALIPYENEEEAIRIANDSEYGLAGCVFTRDVGHGFEIARRVQSGTFSVNTYAADFNSPFGGYKRSGIGREHGIAGLEGYLITKTISLDPSERIPTEIAESTEFAPPPIDPAFPKLERETVLAGETAAPTLSG
jgi:aldehyde dehydrogenase (NAD+)